MTRIVLALTDPRSALLVRGQLAYLGRRGFDVHLVTGRGEPAGALAAAEGATHHAVDIQRDIALGSDPRALAQLVGLLARLRPTLIDGSTPKAGLLAMVAATVSRVPVRVHTLRGLRHVTARGARRAVLWAGHRVTCQLAHQVICVGPSLRARAIALGVVAADRAVVLGPGSGNGVDPARFDPVRHAAAGAALRAAHGATGPVVAFVGRVSRDKGLAELVAAWARLGRADAQLWIVGPDDPTDPIDGATRAALAAPTIHLLGDQREVGPIYAAADVVVLPSHREGLANVLLEAGAMATPAVASRIPGCVDVIVDGVTGALVEVGDVAGLARAIAGYLTDPARAAAHGAAAQARVLCDFRMSEVWARVADQYAALIDQRGRRGLLQSS
jgi:glycosyltransferase involved in cell wall biosynthesis